MEQKYLPRGIPSAAVLPDLGEDSVAIRVLLTRQTAQRHTWQIYNVLRLYTAFFALRSLCSSAQFNRPITGKYKIAG